MSEQQWLIPATKGLGFKLDKGQIVRVTDVEGEQVADFAAYNAVRPNERIDPGVTIDALGKMNVLPGTSSIPTNTDHCLRLLRILWAAMISLTLPAVPRCMRCCITKRNTTAATIT